MIKRLLISFLFVLVSVLGAKASDDNWTLYPSYHNATYCQVMGDRVYVLASGALYSYSKSDNEVRTYDKITTLSDIDIAHIRYSSHIKALVIVYSNANIDVLYDDGSVYNISDFKNKSLPDKTINNIDVQGSIAYLSTSFGVVVLDLENMEFDNTYNTGLDTTCAYWFKDRLYTATKTGLYYCEADKNMLDKGNWERLHTDAVKALCGLDDRLYCVASDGKLLEIIPTANELKTVDNGDNYNCLYRDGNALVVISASRIMRLEGGAITKLCSVKEKYGFILKDKETYWCCNGYGGLQESAVDNNILVANKLPLIPNSPIRNYCEYLKFTDSGKLLVAGGNINYLGLPENDHEATLMEYNSEYDRWNNITTDSIRSVTRLKYSNMCSIDEDPTEPGRYFAGSFGYGVCEFKDGVFIQHYDYNNSLLESAVPNNRNYVRVPTVKFDKDGNLWCVNTTNVANIVKVLKKGGEWVSLKYKDIEYMETMVKPYIDSRGWLWVTSLQGDAGLFCAKMNNTPFDTSDDVTKKWLNKFTNQDGISYDIYQLYDIAEDKSGAIWVGTNVGVFVIDNPEKFFNEGVFKQIKIARNDGTGLADYFMSGVYIKDIEVDGADRKWIGTNSNGIYLVSADGQETIHYFTTENSPLPSDCIESIAIDSKTGEVYIGTDKGLASYRGDAVAAADKLVESNIHVYPNPVRADYSGNISIIGLTHGCVVKIVDTAGFLVNEGVSNGGMYSWNGRDARGEKVASGVYHVLTYDSDGREGVATKILITR